MFRRTLPALAIVLALVLAGSALADTQHVLDPDDSPGGLDLAEARHSHKVTRSGRVILRFRLSTYEAWQFADEEEQEFISVEFNLDRDNAVERCADVNWRLTDGNVQPYADVYKDCTPDGTGGRLGSARNVTRPDEKSLTVRLARKVLGRRVRIYEWRIVTTYGLAGSQECPIVVPGGPPHGTQRYQGICRDTTPWQKHSL